jgi:hypothetical protein
MLHKSYFIVRFEADRSINDSIRHGIFESLETAIKAAERIKEGAVITDNYTVVELKQVYDSNPNHRYSSDHDGLLHDKK